MEKSEKDLCTRMGNNVLNISKRTQKYKLYQEILVLMKVTILFHSCKMLFVQDILENTSFEDVYDIVVIFDFLSSVSGQGQWGSPSLQIVEPIVLHAGKNEIAILSMTIGLQVWKIMSSSLLDSCYKENKITTVMGYIFYSLI